MNKLAFAIVFAVGAVFAGCSGCNGQSKKGTSNLSSFGANSNSNVLVGAGSSLVFPLILRISAEYGKQTHVMINYQSIGSAKGILQLTNKRVDFIFIDSTMKDEQTRQIPAPILEIPVCNAMSTSGTVNKGPKLAVLYKEQNYDGRGLQRAQKLLKLFWWSIHGGQKDCRDIGDTPLLPAEVTLAEKTLKSATFDGKPILQ